MITLGAIQIEFSGSNASVDGRNSSLLSVAVNNFSRCLGVVFRRRYISGWA